MPKENEVQELNPNLGDLNPEQSDENTESQAIDENQSEENIEGTDGNQSQPNTEAAHADKLAKTQAYYSRQMRKLEAKIDQFANVYTDRTQQTSTAPPEQTENGTSGTTDINVQIQRAVEEALTKKEMSKQYADEEKVNKSFLKQEEKFMDEHDDYEELVGNLMSNQDITKTMIDSIKSSPNAVETIYQLGKEEPQEFERISKLSPMQQVREMTLLEAKYNMQNNIEPQVKANPHKPLSPVNSKGGTMSHNGNSYNMSDRLSELRYKRR